MKRLRIGVACYPTFGGSGVMATELGLALAERGHILHFFAYEQPIRLASFRENITYHQVTVLEYPLFKYPSYNLALATKMADVAESEKLDLLHVHYAIPHAASAFLAQEMLGRDRIRTIVTLHGTDITVVGTDPSYQRVMRFCLDRADAVTAVSTYLKDATESTYDLKKEVHVIHNFVDTRRFGCVPCAEAKQLRKSDECVLCHVSNFRPVKRVQDLVKAFAKISCDNNVRLVMVGDGPERAGCEQLVRSLGVHSKVRFLGLQEDIESILPCTDIFVLPSEFESFGLAALEAMASSVAVVASDAGGIPEVVRDGVTGLLYPMGDVDALADRMQRLVRDPARRIEMGRAGRQDAENRFALGTIVGQYEDLYAKTVSRPQGADE